MGIAATAYHVSSGRLRKHLRKLDYWSISLCSTAAVRAALPAKSQVNVTFERHIHCHSGIFLVSKVSAECVGAGGGGGGGGV